MTRTLESFMAVYISRLLENNNMIKIIKKIIIKA